MNKKSVIAFITDLRFLFWFLVILTILVSFAQSRQGFSHMWTPAIFKLSFYNLTHNQNMYALHNQFEGQWVDIYKYSPAFALLYAPIAALPLSIGMIVWNLLNVIVFFFAIRSLPFDNVKKAIIIAIGLLELILSVQNSQSNILMCGLIILGFTNMEKKNVLLATLCIVLSIYIKLFGVVALMIFLFYPEKLKFIGYTILWSIILFFLPLLVVSVTELSKIYHDWAAILKLDATEVWQLSIMGVAKAWFGLSSPQIYIQLVGAIFLAIPLISFKSYQNIQFRLLYLASILIWVVTFNHKAESPSYIIAATGIGIWFV
ncbi:MAG TPA: glycosyltransferase family 87 protein, partial [Bacteroidia bacterium]|nr:glycosyltransferase family 87 protein [Bacteroidia bacterium]